MPDWNDLATETKKEIIQNLDFMSRISMKSTCRQNRDIVKSIKLNIPCVRFAGDDEECLLVIYTGIEQFLRLEFLSRSYGVIMRKYENSYKDYTTKRFQSPATPLQLATQILYNLFADNKKITLDTIEWEVENVDRITLYLILAKFGVLKKVHNYEEVCQFYAKKCVASNIGIVYFCHQKTLKKLEELSFDVDGDFMKPRHIVDTRIPFPDANYPYYTTTISTDDAKEFAYKALSKYSEAFEKSLSTIRIIKREGFENCLDLLDVPAQKVNKKVTMKKLLVHRKMALRYNVSECGTWIHGLLPKTEKMYSNLFKNETCGLGYLCEKCTDPFEYWYYNHNMPRRIHNEPKWCAVFSENQDKMEELKKKYAEEEKSIEQNPIKSWGFKIKEIEEEDSEDSDVDSDEEEEEEEEEEPVNWEETFNNFLRFVRSARI